MTNAKKQTGASNSLPHRIARVFLLGIAGVIGLLLVVAIIWNVFQEDLWRLAYVPGEPFDASAAPPPADYSYADAWAARPGTPGPGHAGDVPDNAPEVAVGTIPVFFIHPTTFLDKSAWNAAYDNPAAGEVVDLGILKNQASAFNAVGPVWAPRYRQATFGSFLDTDGNGPKALQLAYGDVLRAFDQFTGEIGDSPFLLAGHSQGALHGLTLLMGRISGTPLADQMVAAYLVGWPISIEKDLKPLGFDACQRPTDTGCVSSWQSFAPDGDASAILALYDTAPTLDGGTRAGTRMVCVNPLTGRADTSAAPATANLGGARSQLDDAPLAPLVPQVVGAACDEDGILRLSRRPGEGFDAMILPGDNFHVYDLHLFWANVRENAARRAQAFIAERATTDGTPKP